MVRPFGVKVRKLKKRKLEEEEAPHAEEAEETDPIDDDAKGAEEAEAEEEEGGGEEDEKIAEAAVNEMAGLPVMKSVDGGKKPGVIFVLERASLEFAKVGKALLAILDSPLTKAGRLQALYVRTEKGVLFEVKPYVRMPRTFKRFCGLMLQLLQSLSITAAGKREKLLNVIKNPVTRHLPVQSRKIGLSYSSDKVVQLRDYVAAASDDVNLVFVVGAMAHGKIDKEYTDDFISISNYPLSAACCIGRICNSLEQKWKII